MFHMQENIQANQVFPNLVAATETSVAGSVQGTASVTYPGQGPLPAYQEKQQPVHAS